MKKTDSQGTQSIGRAVAILRAVASVEGKGSSLAEISRLAGLERSTAHRMLKRLVEEQLVTQDPVTRCYYLGPVLYELGLAAKPAIPVHEWCSEGLAELARLSGDCTFLIGMSAYDSVCLARREGHFPIKVLVLSTGQRRPLGAGAGSIALMSLLPDDQVRHILDHNQRTLQERGEPPVDELWRIIDRTRREGYATKDAPNLPVRSLSMPVVDQYGRGLCALSVTSLTPRIEQRTPMLVDTLHAITRDLNRRVRNVVTLDNWPWPSLQPDAEHA